MAEVQREQQARMEKASRAIRRSGVKLLSIPGGHADLNMLLSEIKDIRHSAKLLMNAQHLASQDMMKWAANEENRAIQDVISQCAELNLMWTEVQKLFIEHLKEYRHMFEQVLEGEKKVSEAKTNLNYCEEKENKVKKEFKRVAKRATASEMHIFENKVSCAEKSREMAQLELTERLRENEAIKLIQIKSGMLKISEAYVDMSSKCNVLFSAQKNVVNQIPDVHTQEIETIKYTGAGTTRFIVQQAREKLEKYNQPPSQDPPPPYTPPEPGSGVSAGSTPQPAPRRSGGGRDSNLAPVSNITYTTQDITDSSVSDTKILHTHKLTVKMVDKPGIDSDGSSSKDAAVEDSDKNSPSTLYPVLNRDSDDPSQTKQDKPVPVPRPRLSHGSAELPRDSVNETKNREDNATVTENTAGIKLQNDDIKARSTVDVDNDLKDKTDVSTAELGSTENCVQKEEARTKQTDNLQIEDSKVNDVDDKQESGNKSVDIDSLKEEELGVKQEDKNSGNSNGKVEETVSEVPVDMNNDSSAKS